MMTATTTPVFKIIPTTQQYEWGKRGRNSTVAQFADAACRIEGRGGGFTIDERSPYAELWMGTHPKSPSHVVVASSESRPRSLSAHLRANPALMGEAVLARFADDGAREGNLPFLFKVLSIEKALSIQTHPDKKTAEILHGERPDVYKDANHKPEMALALTPFQALCGFRPLPEIASFLVHTPELNALIPPSVSSAFLSISSSSSSSNPEQEQGQKTALKDVFAALMTAPEEDTKKQLDALLARYDRHHHHHHGVDVDVEIVDLVRRLAAQFPGDVGVFCAFVLNFVRLEPGQAIFLGAGEPHAYIHGECIECMANSDNVIRAGLTPKLRDVPNLVSGLTYVASPPSRHVVNPSSFTTTTSTSTTSTTTATTTTATSASSISLLYDPPIPEFSVVQVVVLKGHQGRERHRAVDGPSLAIVTDGSGVVSWDEESGGAGSPGNKLPIGRGEVFFVGAGVGLLFESEEGMTVYRAFVEVVVT